MDKRRITQETFDAVVTENIEDFDMDSEDALREAIEQFESQGSLAKMLNLRIVLRLSCSYFVNTILSQLNSRLRCGSQQHRESST